MHLAAPFPAVIEACFPIIADEENDGRPRVSAINAYDRRKRTPLHRAAAAGAIESIHLLVSKGRGARHGQSKIYALNILYYQLQEYKITPRIRAYNCTHPHWWHS